MLLREVELLPGTRIQSVYRTHDGCWVEGRIDTIIQPVIWVQLDGDVGRLLDAGGCWIGWATITLNRNKASGEGGKVEG